MWIIIAFGLGTAAVVVATGSNSTAVWSDGSCIESLSWSGPGVVLSASPFERPDGPSIENGRQLPLHSLSSSPSLPSGILPVVSGSRALIDPSADFQPSNQSLSGPWVKNPARLRVDLDLDDFNGPATEDGSNPPPKPPFPKSYGKRPWDPKFDHDDEEDESAEYEGQMFESQSQPSNFMDSSLSALWLRHLRSSISASQYDHYHENESSSKPGVVSALTGAAFCLATTQSPEKRKKKKQKKSPGESSATGAQRSQSPSLSSTYNHCNSDASSSASGVLSGRTLEFRERSRSSNLGTDSGTFRQPGIGPTSHECLVAEVKGIYAGLAMVEAECIETESRSGRPSCLSNIGWQRLIALHRSICCMGDKTELEATRGNLNGKIDLIETDGENGKSHIGSELTYREGNGGAHPTFNSSDPSPNGAYDDDKISLLDNAPFENLDNPTAPKIIALFDQPEPPPGHMLSGSELTTGEAEEETLSIAPDLEPSSDNDWLHSFLDLRMCSQDHSDSVPDTATFADFLDQPELFPPPPTTYGGFDIFIEPHLTVMSQLNQADGTPYKVQSPSLRSSDEEMESSRGSRSTAPPDSLISPPDAQLVLSSKTTASHEKENMKECTYCHKFFSPSELRKHIKYHTRPTHCLEADCEYTCANDHDLKRHHVTHHGEAQIQNCPIEHCKVTFTRRYNLLRHVRNLHGDEVKKGN